MTNFYEKNTFGEGFLNNFSNFAHCYEYKIDEFSFNLLIFENFRTLRNHFPFGGRGEGEELNLCKFFFFHKKLPVTLKKILHINKDYHNEHFTVLLILSLWYQDLENSKNNFFQVNQKSSQKLIFIPIYV